MIVRSAQASLASRVDGLFTRLAINPSRSARARSPSEGLGPVERLERLARLEEQHRAAIFRAEPERFFGRAGEPGPWTWMPRRPFGSDGHVVEVSWASGYRPAALEPEVRAAYEAWPENGAMHARLYLHEDRPRPTLVLVHGYGGGRFPFEERKWPLELFFDRLGLDVAVAVLPFHGPRRRGVRRPLFPSADPRLTVEGFRQAVYDLWTLGARLRARGAPAVGMMGMSLGGYITALSATTDPRLAFAVPVIPLASIADFALHAGRLVGTESQVRAQHAALERVYAPVSPLHRPSRLPPERVRVLAGAADRVTPVRHAERLAEHFRVDVHVFHGGHLLQFGRREGFEEVARMLRALDLAR
ncbi:MAG: alpha/beta hydrolase family protein [Sandaracinaceae bacterium]